MSQQSNHEPETLEAPAECGYEQEELRLAGEPGACPDLEDFDADFDDEERWTLVESDDQLFGRPAAVDLSGFGRLADGMENRAERVLAHAAGAGVHEASTAHAMALAYRLAAGWVREELARVKGGA